MVFKGVPGSKNTVKATGPLQPPLHPFHSVFQVLEGNRHLCKGFRTIRKELDGLSETDILVAVHNYLDEYQQKASKSKDMPRIIKEARTIVEKEFVKLGLCCGKFLKTIATGCLLCYADESGCNNIKPGSSYYLFDDSSRNITVSYCQTHFDSIKEDVVVIINNKIPKTDFDKLDYKLVEPVDIEECEICPKRMHEPCRCVKLFREETDVFCHRENDVILNMDNTHMVNVPLTTLATFVQDTVAAKNPTYKGILVREVYSKLNTSFSSSDAEAVKEKFQKFNIELTDYSYRKRMIMVSQKQNLVDTIFMVFIVKEFPQTRWCTLDLLDSVPFVEPFLPEEKRRALYHSIILAYASYAGSIGYKHLYFHAAPPDLDQTYLFKYKQAKRARTYKETRNELLKFYVNMLDYGRKEGMVGTYYRGVQLNLEKQSIPEMYTSIAFASYFQNQIGDGLDKYISGEIQFDLQKYKEELLKALNKDANNSDSFFYINLNTECDEVIENNKFQVVTPFCESRQKFMNAQYNRNWEFTSLEQAKYASLRCIKAILKGDACENAAKQLGEWFHEDFTKQRCAQLPRYRTKDSYALQPPDDVPVEDALVVFYAKTQAAETDAPATAIVGQSPVPKRQYKYDVHQFCVVRHLGRGWDGRIAKVGAKKKNVRGYRVTFKCFAVNFVIFVPYGDADKKLYESRSAYDRIFNPPTTLDELWAKPASQRRNYSGKETEVPSEATPVSTGNQNRHKRQHAGDLGSDTRSNGRHEVPEGSETPTHSQEEPVEQFPTAKKKSRRQ